MILKSHIIRMLVVLSFLQMSVTAIGQQDIDVLLMAKACLQSGKPEEAVAILSRVIDEKGGVRFYAERGEAYLVENNLAGAISDFNQANRLSEHSGDYGLAKVYALKGDASTSMYHLGLHLSSAFKKSEKEIMLEPAFRYVENRPEWRQLWKKQWYSIAETSVSQIEYLSAQGKIRESEIMLSELRINYPGSDETLFAEALISIASGRNADAVSTLTRLISSNPDNEKYMRVLAKAHTGNLNPAGASSVYTKLLESGVADAWLLIMRAECYRKTRETDKAIRDIERFLVLYPESKEALSLAGKVKAESGDNLKALEYFTKNLKLHPNDPDCYIDRASSYFVSRSWELAVNDYSMSLDLNPVNSDAWLNKGIALIGKGKISDACYDFKRSYSLGNQRAASYISKHCLNR